MLLEPGDVAQTRSTRRRAPPAADPASSATGCAGNGRLEIPQDETAAEEPWVSSAATVLPGRQHRKGERIGSEETRGTPGSESAGLRR